MNKLQRRTSGAISPIFFFVFLLASLSRWLCFQRRQQQPPWYNNVVVAKAFSVGSISSSHRRVTSSGISSRHHAQEQQQQVVTTYVLVDEEEEDDRSRSSHVVGRCCELLEPLVSSSDEEEDEVALWYPTARRTFQFLKDDGSKEKDDDDDCGPSSALVTVRRTSFGCSKHGYTVWPSAIVLCLDMVANAAKYQNKKILELGAGIGLPSVVAKNEIVGASSVMATDFWKEKSQEDDSVGRNDVTKDDRLLVPEYLHGANLAYNVVGTSATAAQQGSGQRQCSTDTVTTVQNLDWRDVDAVKDAKATFRPDVVVGSDLVYYPSDLPYLCNVIETFMNNDDAEDATTNCWCQDVILVSPFDVERKALPEFQKWIERKKIMEDSSAYRIRTNVYRLYRQNREVDDKSEEEFERFLKVSFERK